jgi:diaminohydroxyphosphoribosylaminopyrimidine deaminase/5-amino-6-(5-phosphoribosylamino)uracil reductase
LGVTLKLATSLDGRIATAKGESRWITGPEALQQVHRLRAEHDAVVIGIETALADDPELTVRLPGHEGPQPTRVVLDSRQRLRPDSKLVRTAQQVPTVVLSLDAPNDQLVEAGVQVVRIDKVSGERPELKAAVRALGKLGLTRLFVEGGGQVAASFLRAGLVERLEWFRAPMILGQEGRPAIGGLNVHALFRAPRFRRISAEPLGEDLWERYEGL